MKPHVSLSILDHVKVLPMFVPALINAGIGDTHAAVRKWGSQLIARLIAMLIATGKWHITSSQLM